MTENSNDGEEARDWVALLSGVNLSLGGLKDYTNQNSVKEDSRIYSLIEE